MASGLGEQLEVQKGAVLIAELGNFSEVRERETMAA